MSVSCLLHLQCMFRAKHSLLSFAPDNSLFLREKPPINALMWMALMMNGGLGNH